LSPWVATNGGELAKQLARKNPRTGKRRSSRDIGAELARVGHTVPKKDGKPSGNPYLPGSVKLMLSTPRASIEIRIRDTLKIL
jgi:hypothetical protein